jgi:type II secretory pathway component PulF
MVSFSSRISTKQLAAYCRRMATSLGAGVDIRRTTAREADMASGLAKQRLEIVRDAVNRGDSLASAIKSTGEFFPVLLRQLVAVGEQTGQTAEVFKQLAEHYEHQLSLRRSFVRSITWPAIQLFIALGVIGLLIWVSGWLTSRGSKTDFLGWGLVGSSGLLIYVFTLAVIASTIVLLVRAGKRGAFFWGPVQRFFLRVPQLGGAIRTLTLARFAWILHLTLDAGMEIKRAVRLALESSGNVLFNSAADEVVSMISMGHSLTESLAAAHCFPREFLETVQVGEESGRLPETLAHVSKQLDDEARGATAILTAVAGYLVWALVAALIIVLIFRLFGNYVGTINSLL